MPPKLRDTRSLRIPDNPWLPAQDQAHHDGTSVTAEVRWFLTQYARLGGARLRRMLTYAERHMPDDYEEEDS